MLNVCLLLDLDVLIIPFSKLLWWIIKLLKNLFFLTQELINILYKRNKNEVWEKKKRKKVGFGKQWKGNSLYAF